jgi:UDP-N-acetylglucosamine 1-carboxyvinyltransferase
VPAKPREKFDPRTQERLRATGDHLRKTRKKLGISRAKLAETLGMHLMNYARIEQGKQNVTMEMLSRIADALGVEVAIKFIVARKP